MAGVLFFAAALFMCPSPVLLFWAVLLHEGGHLLCASFLHWSRPAVHLGPAGIALRYAGVHPPWQELLVCMAGPAVNFAAAFFSFLLHRAWNCKSFANSGTGRRWGSERIM